MYAGHFAAGLALKAARPRTPTWMLLLGAGLLDIAFGILVAIGVEGAAPDYARSHILIIPWSHSLLGAMILGGFYALVLGRWARGAMLVLFTAVLSHWALDVFVHEPDMSWWPGPGATFGFAGQFGPVSGWFETLLVVLMVGVYAFFARTNPLHGRRWRMVASTIALLWTLGLAA